ncbi:MAG: VIT1/CCC1 transporter family protein [Solirubrobacterales bacterium]
MEVTSALPQRTAPRRVLDPVERISEVLFGLIMALTFTGSISVSASGPGEIHTMLVGAIGCNIAWGIVDMVMYFVTTLVERGRLISTLHSIRSAVSPEEAHAGIADAMSSEVAAVLARKDLETIRMRLVELPAPPVRPHLTWSDLAAGVAIFLLVALSTFPVAIPFAFIDDVPLAMRVSNGVALVLLFACGCSLGRYAGGRTLLMGLSMVAVGAVLVGVTIALGG